MVFRDKMIYFYTFINYFTRTGKPFLKQFAQKRNSLTSFRLLFHSTGLIFYGTILPIVPVSVLLV